jgi:hypothetical protein
LPGKAFGRFGALDSRIRRINITRLDWSGIPDGSFRKPFG